MAHIYHQLSTDIQEMIDKIIYEKYYKPVQDACIERFRFNIRTYVYGFYFYLPFAMAMIGFESRKRLDDWF
jgi:hypothetical protein